MFEKMVTWVREHPGATLLLLVLIALLAWPGNLRDFVDGFMAAATGR